MKILLIGLSHKTAPVDIREKLTFTPTMLRSALTHFDATHPQAHLEGVNEGIILSTCNRLEVYTLVHDPKVAKKAVIDFLGRACDIGPERFVDHLYFCLDEAAVNHLFRVASGLDSMVLGEPQILGQITDAFEAAQAQRAVRTVLSALMRGAIHTGKRARTETGISVNPSSVSSVAASTAVELLGSLSQRNVLLIGAGEMGAIAAKALQKRGASDIVVANRTFANAAELAEELQGRAMTFQQLPAAMIEADIIITSTGAPHTILDRELVEPAMAARPERPLFIIDIAVPRDVDPNVTEIDRVYLRDIDSLQEQANDNVQERQAEIPRVEAIVGEETGMYIDWFSSLGVVPTITDIRQQMEQVRQRELEYLFRRVDLDERERELVMKMSHRLVNKILHEPTTRLRREAANGNGPRYTSVLRHLFALDKWEKHK